MSHNQLVLKGRIMPQEYILDLIKVRVAPADSPWDEGIISSDGKTEPFVVERSWSGPAGHYIEQWSIRSGGSAVLYESEPERRFVRGLQSVSTFTDLVSEPLELAPATYQLVFIVEGRYMGSADFEVGAKKTAAV